MIQSLYTGANAVSAYMNNLTNIAHNTANINTPYFKSNSIHLNELQFGGVNVSSIRQNQSYSYTISSGRTLDFVIEGDGMFKLEDNGDDFLTRRGVFYLDGDGDIVDGKGRVLLYDVVKDGETVNEFEIDSAGTFSINGDVRGKIAVVDSNGVQMTENQYLLKTGMLEASDVDAAREIVDMLVNQRSVTANYANIRASNEMLGYIIDLVS